MEYEFKTTIKVEPCLEINFVSSDDSGPNRDHVEVDPVPPIYADSPQLIKLICINCSIKLERLKRHSLNSEHRNVISVIQQWVTPLQITEENFVCDACWKLAQDAISQPEGDSKRSVGHCNICVQCGRSLYKVRFHQLRDETQNLKTVVSESIAPQILQSSDIICHPCYQRVQKVACKVKEKQVPQNNTIHLPNYVRSPITNCSCFYPNCVNKERLTIPNSVRMRLFIDYNFYVIPNCRICEYHLSNPEEIDVKNMDNPIHDFTAQHIEDFTSLLKKSQLYNIDFNNILNMDEHLVNYWYGFTKKDIQDILNQVPALASMHRGLFALGAYLMKLRTRDSSKKIALLLKTPRSTLERLMARVKELLNQDFVPPVPLNQKVESFY